MKIVGISGSPRKESQTKKLLERCIEIIKKEGVETEIIDLREYKVGFCLACEMCHKNYGCVLKDDGNLIMEKMLSSDGIIFASPNYINNVSAQMKALFDRTTHFIHCLRLYEKYTAGIVSYGGSGGEIVLDYIKHYSLITGAQYSGGIGVRVPLKESDYIEAENLGKKLLNAIKEKEIYPDQIEIIKRNEEHFKNLVNLRKEEWVFEYNYWREKGKL